MTGVQTCALPISDFFRGLAPGLRPLLAAERMQRRGFRRRAGVAADQVQLRDRHVQAVALGVLDLEVFAGLAAGFERHQAAVAADAVVLVHDRRAFRSDEHTSELQSLTRISYAVLCLEKKTKQLIKT